MKKTANIWEYKAGIQWYYCQLCVFCEKCRRKINLFQTDVIFLPCLYQDCFWIFCIFNLKIKMINISQHSVSLKLLFYLTVSRFRLDFDRHDEIFYICVLFNTTRQFHWVTLKLFTAAKM